MSITYPDLLGGEGGVNKSVHPEPLFTYGDETLYWETTGNENGQLSRERLPMLLLEEKCEKLGRCWEEKKSFVSFVAKRLFSLCGFDPQNRKKRQKKSALLLSIAFLVKKGNKNAKLHSKGIKCMSNLTLWKWLLFPKKEGGKSFTHDNIWIFRKVAKMFSYLFRDWACLDFFAIEVYAKKIEELPRLGHNRPVNKLLQQIELHKRATTKMVWPWVSMR